MSRQSIQLTPRLYDYLLEHSLREPPILQKLREETARHPRAGMQIAPDQGQFMRLLLQLMGARRTVEVGVFTGYSSLSTALALPPNGQVIACDVSEEFTAVARRYWREAGVDGKIDLRLGPAVTTLAQLLRDGQAGTFDFAFIDADKENYVEYYEQCLQLLRPGGLIAIDNVLWNGSVADTAVNDVDTVAIRAVNERVHGDDRVLATLLPVGDGLTLALKR
jgi:caffeoyl-CoA O-methyltransferase